MDNASTINRLPDMINDAYDLGNLSARRIRGIGVTDKEMYTAAYNVTRNTLCFPILVIELYAELLRAAYLAGYYDTVEPIARSVTPVNDDLPVTLSERRELVRNEVTLNGKRAQIVGVTRPFATVAQIPTGEAYEWNWYAVRRIVANGGKFKS